MSPTPTRAWDQSFLLLGQPPCLTSSPTSVWNQNFPSPRLGWFMAPFAVWSGATQFFSSKPNCLPWYPGNPLLTFEPVTDEFVLKIISNASAKPCELNPIPTTFLYENLDILLPTIMNIINTSLTTGIVPRDLKTAVIKPLLKKPSFDKNLLKNYCPISNLPFLSKSLENVVLHKLYW